MRHYEIKLLCRSKWYLKFISCLISNIKVCLVSTLIKWRNRELDRLETCFRLSKCYGIHALAVGFQLLTLQAWLALHCALRFWSKNLPCLEWSPHSQEQQPWVAWSGSRSKSLELRSFSTNLDDYDRLTLLKRAPYTCMPHHFVYQLNIPKPLSCGNWHDEMDVFHGSLNDLHSQCADLSYLPPLESWWRRSQSLTPARIPWPRGLW